MFASGAADEAERATTLIRAAFTLLLIALNAIFWGIPILSLGIVKLIAPEGAARRRIRLALTELGNRWSGGNNRVFRRMVTTRWDVSGVDGLRADGRYLILSNHVSWLDIFVLQLVFHRRVAFMRFFVKQQFIWFPIIGQGCWAMDFPFMRRYSPEYLQKHPEKRGHDLEVTRRTCQRYRHIPVAILNFLEGTRFTREKHAALQSPYRHLLPPRVGGTAFVLASLGEQLDSILDVTIAYPAQEVTLGEFLSNRIERVVVRVRVLEVPAQFVTGTITDPGPARDAFREWVERLWREKDDLLEGLGIKD